MSCSQVSLFTVFLSSVCGTRLEYCGMEFLSFSRFLKLFLKVILSEESVSDKKQCNNVVSFLRIFLITLCPKYKLYCTMYMWTEVWVVLLINVGRKVGQFWMNDSPESPPQHSTLKTVCPPPPPPPPNMFVNRTIVPSLPGHSCLSLETTEQSLHF